MFTCILYIHTTYIYIYIHITYIYIFMICMIYIYIYDMICYIVRILYLIHRCSLRCVAWQSFPAPHCSRRQGHHHHRPLRSPSPLRGNFGRQGEIYGILLGSQEDILLGSHIIYRFYWDLLESMASPLGFYWDVIGICRGIAIDSNRSLSQ